MNIDQLTPAVLGHFTGTTGYHRVFPWNILFTENILLTDGVMHVIENADAFWLAGEIGAGYDPSNDYFQVFKLTVDLDTHKAVLTLTDGDGKALGKRNIDWTDFPLPEMTFWVVNGVVMLPSEY